MLQVAFLLLCYAAAAVNAQQVSADLEGYRFMTNIDDKLKLPNDIASLNALIDARDWTAAVAMFNNGNQSSISLASIADQAVGEEYFDLQRTYYGIATPAKTNILGALQNTGAYTKMDVGFRDETASKMIGSTVIFGAIYHELALGLKNCRAGAPAATIVANVDNAWAYFGSNTFSGLVSRCSRTGSCINGDSTRSVLTNELLSLYTQAQVAGIAQDCERYAKAYQRIREIQSINVLQNVLRYVANTKAEPEDPTNMGEGWGFAFAMLPSINKCNPTAATMLRNNFDPALTAVGMSKNTVAEVSTAITSVLPCLNLKCTQFAPGTCTDAPALYTAELNGYRFQSDVGDRVKVAQDIAEINTLIDARNFAGAVSLFNTGKASSRSLASLADQASGEEYYELQKAYYYSSTPGRDNILGALQGTGDYAKMAEGFRDETASKMMSSTVIVGAIYHELAQGLAACNAKAAPATIVSFVDNAWAYFGSNSYSGLVSRCSRTGTCIAGDPTRSVLTNQLLALYNQAQVAATTQDCTLYATTFTRIREISSINVLQNILRYVANTKAEQNDPTNMGEGWGFSFSMLPVINKCNAAAATMLRNNFDPKYNSVGMVYNSAAEVSAAVVSVFPCLNLKCSQFGPGTCTDAVADSSTLYDYTFQTDVAEKLKMRQDVSEIGALIDAYNWTGAEQLFLNGKNSRTATGLLRSLSSIADKSAGEEYYELQRAYYGSNTPAKDTFLAAVRGTGAFAKMPEDFRDEVANKMLSSTFMTGGVFNELGQGLAACKAGSPSQVIVANVDSAWAYFATSSFSGLVSRCKQTSSCIDGDTTRSRLSNELLAYFTSAQVAGTSRDCERYEVAFAAIKRTMSINTFQNVLRYTVNTEKDPTDFTNQGEGYGFSFSLIPLLNKCSPAAAAMLRNNFDPATSPTGGMKLNTAVQVNAAITGTFPCLGLKCTQFGNGTCTDVSTGEYGVELNGYRFQTDVTSRFAVKEELAAYSALVRVGDFAGAEQVFLNGKYSAANALALIADKSAGEAHFDLFQSYYGSATYGKDVVLGALRGSGAFAGRTEAFRNEVASKAVTFVVLYSAIWHELAQGLNACKAGAAGATIVDFVDAAWVYYGDNLFASLASRCRTTNSCLPNGKSSLNNELLGLFTAAQDAADGQDCNAYSAAVEKIKATMSVNTLQAVHRYAGQVKDAETEEPWGEGWGFSYAVLPLLNKCNPSVAAMVRNNFDPALTTVGMGKNSALEVSKAVVSTYACLGLKCSQFGSVAEDIQDEVNKACPSELASSEGGNTGSNNSSGLDGGQIAGIVIGVVAFYVLSVIAVAMIARKRALALPAKPKGLDENASHASLSRV